MDFFGEMNELFLTLGMTEEQARRAAIGRYGSEAEAREAFSDADGGDLADDLVAEARANADGEPSVRSRTLQEVAAALPLVEENTRRILSGQQRRLMPWEADPQSSTAAGEATVVAAQEALRMTEAEARSLVDRLRGRETRRHGAQHAEAFLTTFAEGLRRNMVEVREVAPW